MAQFVDVLDLDDKQSFIMLLVEEGLSKSEATDAYDSLRLVYEKYQSAFDALSTKQRAAPRHYWILETEEGPRISDSRVMIACLRELGFMELLDIEVSPDYIFRKGTSWPH